MTEEIPNLDLPDPEATAEALRQALGKMPRPLFAVLDGGLFDDLPGDLTRKNIACRSLFLDHADKDIELAGPWLVALVDDEALEHVTDLALAKPCAVFWSCPGGDMALWRHLRSINEILIPAETASGVTIGSKPSGEFRRVLFRHWDPNVLTQTVPALERSQFLRLLGPAIQIILQPHDDWGDKVIRVSRNEMAGTPPKGLLKLDVETIRAIEDRRTTALRKRRIAYLRRTCERETRDAPPQALAEHIRISEETGRQLGLVSQGAHCRWAFIMFKSNGRILRDEKALKYITCGPEAPDQKVRQFMLEAMKELRDRSVGKYK